MRAMPQSVVLSGDLDCYRAAAVRLVLEKLEGPGIVDMRGVRYLDSSALNELARVARRIGLREVTLVVASVNVRRVLQIVEFEKLFTIVDVVRPSDVDVPAPSGNPTIERYAGARDGTPAPSVHRRAPRNQSSLRERDARG